MTALWVIDGGSATAQRTGPTQPGSTASQLLGSFAHTYDPYFAGALGNTRESLTRDEHWVEEGVREIGRLKDGWAGAETIAPSPKALVDMQVLASTLPLGTRAPEIEIDPSDGEIKLAWRSSKEPRSIALTLMGDQTVHIIQSNLVTAPRDQYRKLELDRTAARTFHLLAHSDLFVAE